MQTAETWKTHCRDCLSELSPGGHFTLDLSWKKLIMSLLLSVSMFFFVKMYLIVIV